MLLIESLKIKYTDTPKRPLSHWKKLRLIVATAVCVSCGQGYPYRNPHCEPTDDVVLFSEENFKGTAFRYSHDEPEINNLPEQGINSIVVCQTPGWPYVEALLYNQTDYQGNFDRFRVDNPAIKIKPASLRIIHVPNTTRPMCGAVWKGHPAQNCKPTELK